MPFVLQDCGCADRVQNSAAASWAEEGGAAGLACGRLFASARIRALSGRCWQRLNGRSVYFGLRYRDIPVMM